MPFAPATQLMNLQGLAVRYQASAEPQTLEVSVRMKKKYLYSLLRPEMGTLVEVMASGGASGDEFAPSSSRAKLVHGTFDAKAPGGEGPEFAWTLEVAGISPLFLRVMIDDLAASGGSGVRADSIMITGSLAPSGDPLSVDDRKMSAWLDDPTAFPKACSQSGFPITYAPATRGATVKLGFRNDTSPALLEKIQELLANWSLVTGTFPDAAHKRHHFGMADVTPKLSRKKFEIVARWNEFTFDPKPKFALLTNMLVHFHENEAALVSVEYAHA